MKKHILTGIVSAVIFATLAGGVRATGDFATVKEQEISRGHDLRKIFDVENGVTCYTVQGSTGVVNISCLQTR